MKKLVLFVAFGIAALASSSAQAAVIRFIVPMDALQEVNGSGVGNQGEPGGVGSATLFINDVTNTVTGSFTPGANVTTPITGFHIHQAVVGLNGGIVVDMVPLLTGGSVTDADLASVLATPANFYVNAHNAARPGGTVRGQMNAAQAVTVPEAGTSLLIGAAGMLGLVMVRRRKTA